MPLEPPFLLIGGSERFDKGRDLGKVACHVIGHPFELIVLGVEGYTQADDLHHRNVVHVVADVADLLPGQPSLSRDLLHHLRLLP